MISWVTVQILKHSDKTHHNYTTESSIVEKNVAIENIIQEQRRIKLLDTEYIKQL